MLTKASREVVGETRRGEAVGALRAPRLPAWTCQRQKFPVADKSNIPSRTSPLSLTPTNGLIEVRLF